jgi:RNase P subunit RPR2
MICRRCHGLMVKEQYRDVYEPSEGVCLNTYRCLQCGEIVDAVILENRLQVADSVGSTRRTQACLPRPTST